MEPYSPIDRSFRGVIRAERKGRILLEHVGGYADMPNAVPNTPDTRFGSASAGKAFVAVGILQLAEAGRLSPEDTLGSILGDLHRIDPAVTVRELLTHTSGIPDYFDESVMEEYEELWTDFPNYRIRHNGDLLPLFWDRPMMYPHGTEFRYNNSGYVLLAAVIEAITGMAFDRYLQDHVFAPCGMASTGYYELDRLPARCAHHYIPCGDGYRTHIFSVDAKGTGAGGAYITVPDILRFWQGLMGGKLLSAASLAAMTARQSGDGADPEEGYYGYGLWILPRPGRRDAVYFQGSDPGVSFLSEYDPETDTASVLVSNFGDNVWAEMRHIRSLLY